MATPPNWSSPRSPEKRRRAARDTYLKVPAASSRRQRWALALQRCLSRAAALPLWPLALFWMRWVRGYRIEDLRATRARARALLRRAPGPLLVCPNHLTWIDSLLVQWAIASPWQLLTQFRVFAWNVPEANNFSHNRWLRGACYLAKCLPIRRGGDRAGQRRVLSKLVTLLRQRELVMLFPEGRRSRSGRVEASTVAYGVGKLANAVPGCRVLCIYLRGEKQQSRTVLPERRQRFRVRMTLLNPGQPRSGLRAARTTALEIGAELAGLEEEYFQAFPTAAVASSRRGR